VNLVFIGSTNFGLRCLSACLEIPSLNVVGVVTAPQTFAISYRPEGVSNVLYADVASFAADHDLPSRALVRSMGEPGLFEAVAAWKPHAFLVAGWYHMIPRKWREFAPAYGLHASLLPDYSGGAPLVWAMINGEPKTGITLFQMDNGVDSGPIAGQKEELIYPYDTIATLYARIEKRGLELLEETLPQLAHGDLILKAQDDSKRRVVPQRSPEDGWIDWNQDANTISRFIRAQTRPYPGAYTSFNGKPLNIWCASEDKIPDVIEPAGKVIRLENDRYLVTCGKQTIELKEISYEQHTFGENQLSRLLGGGGQILGDSPNCMRNLKPF
jgi:methionyl-tRNA formyltransferase